MLNFDHLKFRRTVRGEITQTELAAKLGLTQARVSAILQKGKRMTIEQLEQICEVLEKEPTQFFTETN